MESKINIKPKQRNHSEENEPWTPEYQRPELEKDTTIEKQEINPIGNNPKLNKISFPTFSNEWEDIDPR